MGKNKLKKFAEMKEFACVLEYPRVRLMAEEFPSRGGWAKDFFRLDRPITVELGCGKGEYTVGLAQADPSRLFIGVDVKGARIWRGAKTVEERQIPNAAFLRAEIENITSFFAPSEVDELWITFPDPQMQKRRKRLTSTRFLQLYAQFLQPGGVVNLKTDSPFLYEYTRRLVELNRFEVLADTADLYGSGLADATTSIKTFYEAQWLSRGKKIKLLSFRLPEVPEGGFLEPDESDIERDDYHALCRPNIIEFQTD